MRTRRSEPWKNKYDLPSWKRVVPKNTFSFDFPCIRDLCATLMVVAAVVMTLLASLCFRRRHLGRERPTTSRVGRARARAAMPSRFQTMRCPAGLPGGPRARSCIVPSGNSVPPSFCLWALENHIRHPLCWQADVLHTSEAATSSDAGHNRGLPVLPRCGRRGGLELR